MTCFRLYPTDVWALNNRGVVYRKIGKEEKARRDFDEALKIDPGFEQAKSNLASMAGVVELRLTAALRRGPGLGHGVAQLRVSTRVRQEPSRMGERRR